MFVGAADYVPGLFFVVPPMPTSLHRSAPCFALFRSASMNGCVRVRSQRTRLLSRSPVLLCTCTVSTVRLHGPREHLPLSIQIGHDHKDPSPVEVERATDARRRRRDGYRHLIFRCRLWPGPETLAAVRSQVIETFGASKFPKTAAAIRPAGIFGQILHPLSGDPKKHLLAIQRSTVVWSFRQFTPPPLARTCQEAS